MTFVFQCLSDFTLLLQKFNFQSNFFASLGMCLLGIPWPICQLIASKILYFPHLAVDARTPWGTDKVVSGRFVTPQHQQRSNMMFFGGLSICFGLGWWWPFLRNIVNIACPKSLLGPSDVCHILKFPQDILYFCLDVYLSSPNPAHTSTCTSLTLIKKGRSIHRRQPDRTLGLFVCALQGAWLLSRGMHPLLHVIHSVQCHQKRALIKGCQERKKKMVFFGGGRKQGNTFFFKKEEIKRDILCPFLIFGGIFSFRIVCHIFISSMQFAKAIFSGNTENWMFSSSLFSLLIQHKYCYTLSDPTWYSPQMSGTGSRKKQQYLGTILPLFSRNNWFVLIRCCDMKT